MNVDVIVIGAGPTGLMMATELETAGVTAIVVDRAEVGSKMPRAAGIQPRTTEVFDMRGLLEPMLAVKPAIQHGQGHFTGLPLDYTVLAPAGAPMRLEQNEIEDFLERRLAERGVTVLRGHELVGIDQDEHGVTATITGPCGETLSTTGQYLVAADGAHSTVRTLLGVDFPGRNGTETALVADVQVRNATAQQLVDPHARLGRPTVAPDGSWAMVFELTGGWRRMFSSVVGAPGRDVPVTEAEVVHTLHHIFGPEVEVTESRYLSRISNAARQVPNYRDGRVFLAGDAAHVHLPFGGQGLNLGVQDAVNLSWKLVAAVRGHAPEGLLDSYQAERHPVAASVLSNSRAQSLLANFGAVNNTDVPPTREFFAKLLELPEVNRFVTGLLSGVDIRYPMPGAVDSLVGKRLFGIRLSPQRGVLFDPTGALAETARNWADRVDVRSGEQPVLVRPDGYVCWAGAEPGDDTGLADALTHWFGPGMANVTGIADVAAATVSVGR